ncbi:maestro heat-like repeat-containing protein family member 7 [Chelonoidis abingdonii]|uniref:maestro heat-like repeat-containing protein family member 7 n=1 Tax=Chelonoidis abingdonii TaxID=106734 RepID=UPI003F49930E
MRFCNDFRKLNEVSQFDAYPILRIHELIDRMGKARFMSFLDLTKGYWQISLAKANKEKTTFATPEGLHQYTILPFGLHGAPATFQQLTDKLLRPHGKYAAYLDDVIIYSPDWETHLEKVEEVLDTLRKVGLTVNPSKCSAGLAEAKYLGYIAGNSEVKPQLNKLEAIRKWPRPLRKKQVFGKYFHPSECMDFLLTATDGMRHTSLHNSVAARHMLHVILEVPGPGLKRVSEAVTNMYHNLDSNSELQARQELLMALLLGYQYNELVVRILLGCSLSCESIAAEMWRMLTSHPKTAGKVLRELVNRLQKQPLRQYHVSQKEAGIAPLATRALYEILQEQACRQKMKELLPQLYIALLFHITYTVELSMQNIALHQRVHNQEDLPTLLSSVRCTVRAMKSLLQCAGYGDQVTFILKQGGWGMLMNSYTHHKGICLLAWAMVSIRFQECNWIFHKLITILNCRDNKRHILAMAFFMQLLQYPDLSNELEDAILDQMSRQLRDSNTVVCWLALKGLLNLALHPEKVGKLQRLLPDVLERLHEVDRDLIAKAIAVLKHLFAGMDRQSAGRAAVQVAEQLLPLFDDTLKAMDEVLKTLMCEDEKPNLVELQDILEVWRMAEEAPKDPLKPIPIWEEMKTLEEEPTAAAGAVCLSLSVPGPDSEEKEDLDYIETFLTSNEQEQPWTELKRHG